MKNVLCSVLAFIMLFCVMVLGLKACDHEAEQNEIKTRQWAQDAKDGKPYTNYGEQLKCHNMKMITTGLSCIRWMQSSIEKKRLK